LKPVIALLRRLRQAAAIALLGAACALPAAPAYAFDLAALQQQLQQQSVIRGRFVQQKFLRSLPQPLTSTGDFVLATGHGLLWKLRSPLYQDILVTSAGRFRRENGGTWRPVAQPIGADRETRLFLDVLRGDTHALRDSFSVTLSGTASAWQLVLTPESPLLKQIFESIQINGGRMVERIELRETQGDRTVMEMTNTRADNQLDRDEVKDFAV